MSSYTPCPRCSKLIPGKIAVGGMSYLPPRWEKCPKCNGTGKLQAMDPALLPEERETGQLKHALAEGKTMNIKSTTIKVDE